MSYFRDGDARAIVREAYEAVEPRDRYVAEALYAPDELAPLPEGAVRLALGMGHPVRHAALRAGETVLDIGCGAGIDSLLAAQRVGPAGRVIALDMVPAMLERTRAHAALASLTNLEARQGLMEELPLADATVDVVISNGVLNLSTRKSRALAEALRVLRPGGRLALADIVLYETLPEAIQRNPTALAV